MRVQTFDLGDLDTGVLWQSLGNRPEAARAIGGSSKWLDTELQRVITIPVCSEALSREEKTVTGVP